MRPISERIEQVIRHHKIYDAESERDYIARKTAELKQETMLSFICSNVCGSPNISDLAESDWPEFYVQARDFLEKYEITKEFIDGNKGG